MAAVRPSWIFESSKF